jgi:putative tryptophan/tyrosine transport system substrate-binding protein
MKAIRRRDVITLLGGATAAWPLAARAQRATIPIVGFLRSTGAANSTHHITAFRQGLSEAGFVEGQNVAIEYSFADDHHDSLPALTADLIHRQVAVIVANMAAAKAAKSVTSTTPIVFVTGSDPVTLGLVASLNKPGGNLTGVSFAAVDVLAKRLDLLHELVPKATVIGALMNLNNPDHEARVQVVIAAARRLGVEMALARASIESEFDAAFTNFVQQRAGALLVDSGAFFIGQNRQLVALAMRHALPTIASREVAELGGLMSYGASPIDAYRRAASYTGRILKGEKPADLPVQLPTKFELVINLKTAKTLGLNVSRTLLARADHVIE